MTSPLAGRGPADIDFIVVRENVEGEYSEIGGRLYAGTEQEMVSQLSCFTRRGTDRILRYAFELAKKRKRRHDTPATKSNDIVQNIPKRKDTGEGNGVVVVVKSLVAAILKKKK